MVLAREWLVVITLIPVVLITFATRGRFPPLIIWPILRVIPIRIVLLELGVVPRRSPFKFHGTKFWLILASGLTADVSGWALIWSIPWRLSKIIGDWQKPLLIWLTPRWVFLETVWRKTVLRGLNWALPAEESFFIRIKIDSGPWWIRWST